MALLSKLGVQNCSWDGKVQCRRAQSLQHDFETTGGSLSSEILPNEDGLRRLLYASFAVHYSASVLYYVYSLCLGISFL